MTEDKSNPCPQCGAEMPGDALGGLCSACLLKQAILSGTVHAAGGSEPLPPPPSPEAIADKFPQFEIVECLGRGGMGVVYKARQKSLDRWVAIKVLAPERVRDERFATHFEREAKTLAKMSHPHIVTVHDHGETEGLFYIVMEYVDGVNLRDLLKEGKMAPEQALAIVPPVCEALEYAHEQGVVHRDIKPENLLLDRDGRIKIADFGIASLVGATGESSGTPPYMAPEQNGGTVDRRADIYALGAVLYEMLTGERPAEDLVAPSSKVEVDVKIDEMVLRALEKEPERRYQTAVEFRTMVQTMKAPSKAVGAPGGKPTGAASAASPIHNSVRRGKWLRWLSVFGFVGMSAIVTVLFLLTFVVPVMAESWADYGAELPLWARLLLSASRVAKEYALFLIPPLFALGIASVTGMLISLMLENRGNKPSSRVRPWGSLAVISMLITNALWLVWGSSVTGLLPRQASIVFPLFAYFWLVACFFWAVFHYQCWRLLPERHRATSPGKALGYLFIPFFNFYWVFVSLPKLAEGYDAFRRERGLTPDRVMALAAVAYAVNFLFYWTIAWVPTIGLAICVTETVLFLLFYSRVVGSVQQCSAESETDGAAGSPVKKSAKRASERASKEDGATHKGGFFRRWWGLGLAVLLLSPLLGIATGFGWHQFAKEDYSEATAFVAALAGDSEAKPLFPEVISALQSRKTQTQVVEELGLSQRWGMTPAEAALRVQVMTDFRRLSDTDQIEIRVRSDALDLPNEKQALKQICDELVDVLVERFPSVQLVQPAMLDRHPRAGTSVMSSLIAGAAVGLLASPLLALLAMGLAHRLSLWRSHGKTASRPVKLAVGLTLLALTIYLLTLFRGSDEPEVFGYVDEAERPTDPEDAAIWDAIELFGVLPDGGEQIYDAAGNWMGEGMAVGPWTWDEDEQGAALIFNFPEEVPMQWEIFPKIYVAQTDRGMGGVMNHGVIDYLGEKRRIQNLVIDRTYETDGLLGRQTEPVEAIDITMRYHPPGMREAVATFFGPFEQGQTVKAEEGFECSITPSDVFASYGWRFELTSTNAPIDSEDYKRVFAYDYEGNRYVSQSGNGRISGGSEGSSAEREFRIEDVPLSRIAVITLGEKPQGKTFHSVRLRPPDRSPRSHPSYLDAMRATLGLDHLSLDELQDYEPTEIDEIVRVIDILQGLHFDRAWQKLIHSNFDRLEAAQKDKLRRVAQSWMDEGRLEGILMGLKGNWPEFVEPAMEAIQEPLHGLSTLVHEMRGYRDYTPDHLQTMAKVLVASEDPKPLLGLRYCLKNGLSTLQNEAARKPLEYVARSEDVWLWWPAMKFLTGSYGLNYVQLDRELKIKHLAMTDPDIALDEKLAFEARMLLTTLPSSRLDSISTSTLSEVLSSIIRNFPQAEAEAVMLDLLEEMVQNWYDPSDQWWPIDKVVRQLNYWHGLNLGGIGANTDRETSPSHEVDWLELAKQTLEHFGRELPPPLTFVSPDETRNVSTLRLADAFGKPLAHATLDLRPAGAQRSQVPLRPFDHGARVRIRTDENGRAEILWPQEINGKRVWRFIGTLRHPDYGTARVKLSDSNYTQKVPAVPKSSEIYQQALRGQVVDPMGKPVPGAYVGASKAWTDEESFNGKARAVTDSTGRFVLPFITTGVEPRLVPEDAVYDLEVRAPLDLELFPAFTKAKGPVVLQLKEPTLAARQLRFELGEGYAEGDELSAVRLEWAESKADAHNDIMLDYRSFGRGPVRLLPGYYKASYHDRRGRSFDYLPVKIDADSPEVITFEKPPAITYRGRVVDGATGEPVSGAFVYMGSLREKLTMLGENDWDRLENLPLEPQLDDKAANTLDRYFTRVEAIVRTDASGQFVLAPGNEVSRHGLSVFARDRMFFGLNLKKLEPDADNVATLPVVELFPAAYVQFFPKAPSHSSPSVAVSYALEKEGQPDWVERFKKAEGDSMRYTPDLTQPVRFFAPAGLDFTLKIQKCSRSDVKPVFSEQSMRLDPGEVKDLGELKFEPLSDSKK